jgi:hypothetical protein
LLLLLLAEGGFRFGLRLFTTLDEPRKGQISGIQSAVLGMLGLLLGFTFAMAVSRYEMRRSLVVDEANAIGTTYLRASFLPAEHKAAVEELLRRYVDVRISFDTAGTDAAKRAAAEAESARLQREMWNHTVQAATVPTLMTAKFVEALNQTIDLDATRLNALRARVPGAVWLLVLVVAGAGCYAAGYRAGASSERTGFANFLLPLLVTVVITLIVDFDHPYRGFIDINSQPLIDLQASISARGR